MDRPHPGPAAVTSMTRYPFSGPSIGPRRHAELCFNDWAGFRTVAVLVVDETPKRYRIEALNDTLLAGRCRRLRAGERALVPRTAIRFPEE